MLHSGWAAQLQMKWGITAIWSCKKCTPLPSLVVWAPLVFKFFALQPLIYIILWKFPDLICSKKRQIAICHFLFFTCDIFFLFFLCIYIFIYVLVLIHVLCFASIIFNSEGSSIFHFVCIYFIIANALTSGEKYMAVGCPPFSNVRMVYNAKCTGNFGSTSMGKHITLHHIGVNSTLMRHVSSKGPTPLFLIFYTTVYYFIPSNICII